MVKYVSFIGVCFLAGCGAGVSDFIEDLSSGYMLLHEGPTSNFIYYKELDSIVIYPQVESVKISNGFLLVKQRPSVKGYIALMGARINSTAHVFKDKDAADVRSSSDTVFFNKHKKNAAFYRIVAQRVSGKRTEEDWRLTERLADSLLRSSELFSQVYQRSINYWIINKSTGLVLGPYDVEDYQSKKKQLNISDELPALK